MDGENLYLFLNNYIKNHLIIVFRIFRMDFFNIPNDSKIITKAYKLDCMVKKEREDEYSTWTSYSDHKKHNFVLADFVYANICETMPELKNNVLEILWIACCSDHELYEQILKYSNNFLQRRCPERINVLRVDLAHFLQEIAETLATEIEIEERERQKKQFQEYLENNDTTDELPGKLILQEFRKKVHVLYFLPPNNVAVPYFLQVQDNFKDLCKHSLVRHVCRNIENIDTKPPNVYDWLHVIDFVRQIGIKPYSLHGNLNSLSSKQTWPKFLTVYHELFPDQTVSIEERFLQLLTIYHSRWDKIFTLSGWRMNLQETEIILDFLQTFPTPFYQDHFVTELFHLIV